MEIKEEENKESQQSPLPVLPRLDRLDRLVQLLEAKHSSSRRHSSSPGGGKMEPPQEEDQHQRKTLSNALHEVHHKGTLMERLEMLENRVFELSQDMDEEKDSKTSSSNVPISEKSGQSSSLSSKEYEDVITAPVERSELLLNIQVNHRNTGFLALLPIL